MLKNILLKKEWVNQEIKLEIEKYMEANENENMMLQKLVWITGRRTKRHLEILEGRFILYQWAQWRSFSRGLSPEHKQSRQFIVCYFRIPH